MYIYMYMILWIIYIHSANINCFFNDMPGPMLSSFVDTLLSMIDWTPVHLSIKQAMLEKGIFNLV